MPKEVIIYLKKVDPENPHHQEAIYIHDETVAASLTGSRKSPKVSDIRFDESDQKWVAVLRDGRELCRDKNRNVVVQKEATLIAEMFARGEYIPGGYNGEPRQKLPPNLCREMEKGEFIYLGYYQKFDLYGASPKNWIVVCPNPNSGSGKNSMITTNFMGGLQCGVDMAPLPVTHGSEEDGASIECLRRLKIEQQIEEEEKIKTKSHA